MDGDLHLCTHLDSNPVSTVIQSESTSETKGQREVDGKGARVTTICARGFTLGMASPLCIERRGIF